MLTDGSGQRNAPRLNSTRHVLADAAAPTGCLFGQFGDRQIYRHVLEGNATVFLELAERMALDWVRHEIDLVVGDAYEGAIMTHDLWRGVIDRAVEIAEQLSGRSIANIGFSLESHPIPQRLDDPSIHSILRLDPTAWRRKISAAEAYPELQPEIQAAFAAWSPEAFRFEALLIQLPAGARPDWSSPPEYERHGERQVSAGAYPQVVRYRQHVLPILKQLSAARRAA